MAADVLERVSLLAPLHLPEIYDGQRLGLLGLCSFLGDAPAMWISRGGYNRSQTRAAIWLDLAGNAADWLPFHGRVMLAEGTFSRDGGPGGSFGGSLLHITRLEDYAIRDDAPPA